MLERIAKLTELVLAGELYIEHTDTEYDRNDLFLPPVIMNAKRAGEYILNQKPYITENTALTGYLRFCGDVMGDIFNRCGHTNWEGLYKTFYNSPVEELCTFEWQHSVADFEKVIKIGIEGFRAEIQESEKKFTDSESLDFLKALDMIAEAIIGWAHKCSREALKVAEQVESAEAEQNLKKLAKALLNVPEKPAQNFYEAVLTVYIIYAFVPDSIGTIDRYLYPFYQADIASGELTREDAAAYLQELYLMLQARISIHSDRFYRGGESHFCIGGYLEDGTDGFNELSKLVLDSMLELPTFIPQISLRWTTKTPREVLRYVMDCERKDPNKRIAFVNDEPRLKAFTKVAGFPYELACKYTMVGCNEPQLPGGIFMGGCKVNIPKSVERTLYGRREKILKAQTYDEFYKVFEEELFYVLGKGVEYYEKFQSVRARDVNLVSSMFFDGSIERAKSITQGGAKNAVADLSFMGIITTIDSVTIIKQFVYDEKLCTMDTLLSALAANWSGYEELRAQILSQGKFFGNAYEVSIECADRFADSVWRYLGGRKSAMGYNFMIGNLIGYNQHHKFFGDCIKATPDGRFDGEAVTFGICQGSGKDRNNIAALLTSVAQMNKNLIFCGSTVTNVLLDEQLVEQDDNFEKLVLLFESYFKMGGLHFQLSYVSTEDMKQAKVNPEQYKSMRVRVSGFSDYFILLNEDLQDELILRTEKKG